MERLAQIPGAHIAGEHLRLPGYGEEGPTLEIYSYDATLPVDAAVNLEGFSHIAFEVESVEETLARMLEHGGSALGEVVVNDYGPMGVGTFVYARDPEGNIVELQSWTKHG